MSFRGRLRLFFALIVIVPMIALGAVLFALTARTETGKADAGIGTAARTAIAVHREGTTAARPALRRVAADPRLQRALVRDRVAAAERRMRELVRGGVISIELWSPSGRRLAQAGSDTAVASSGSELVTGRGGAASAVLTLSVTDAPALVRRIKRLTELDAVVLRHGRRLASTVPDAAGIDLPPPEEATDIDLGGHDYRGRVVTLDEPRGAPLELAILRPAAPFSKHIADNRLLIAAFLVLFVLFALASATFVSRALTGQIATFLAAAQRLSRGDFRQLVQVEGNDEFAQLGREFNDMSEQLEVKIEEVERKRQELEETIRRVGDALATGLDRDGVVALAVRQAVDACDAEAGRALPLALGTFARYEAGEVGGSLERVIEAAERHVFMVRADVGPELLGALEGDENAERTRRALSAHAEGAHALSIGLRSLVDGPEYLGAVSIARRGAPFTREEEELLEYLAGQAVVSIENASLHETVERQAVTDDLTGLANMRAFTSVLDRELERSRRFDTPLGLVMLDIDDFKQVNDRYGHQQGDEVLAQVAGVLRGLSRDLDAPARYGGEELAVVLPQTDAEGAALLAERMREAIEALQVPRIGGGGPLSVTASFGVASVPDTAADRDSLIAAADAALYRAKRTGKNRVEGALTLVPEPRPRPR
ncbi:MAG TPA: diguanylate cyclase [Thermoleophilaceae bacterium]|nr:diguanylate cyclase [Thermoleophilaceae bacterium]